MTKEEEMAAVKAAEHEALMAALYVHLPLKINGWHSLERINKPYVFSIFHLEDTGI